MIKSKHMIVMLMLLMLVAALTSCEDGGAGSSAEGSNDPVPDYVAAWTLDTDSSASGSGMSGISINETGTVSFFADEKAVGEGSAYFNKTSYLSTSSKVNFNCTEGFTVSFWINIKNFTSVSKSAYLLQWGDSQSIRCGSSSSTPLSYTLGNISGLLSSSDFPLVKGTWAYVTFIYAYDGGKETMKYYYNGGKVYDSSRSTSSMLWRMDGSKIVIGEGFDGYLDDVRFYKRVLSEDEIQVIYNLGS